MKILPGSLFPWMLAAVLAGCATTPPASAPEGQPPSIADAESIEFLGKRFERQLENMVGPTRIHVYYAGSDTPDDWLELVEFQDYPVHQEANAPLDFARRTAAALRQRYPQMQFGLYSVKEGDAALLDFFLPTSTRKEAGKRFIEFNAFKFFRDPGSARTLSFHYARNIEGPGRSRTEDEVIQDLRDARKQVIPAIADFPLYRQ